MPNGLGRRMLLQQRLRQRQQGAGGQQGLLGRMLAARGAQGRQGLQRQGQMRQLGSPLQALARRRAGRMAGNRQLLQKRLAAR